MAPVPRLSSAPTLRALPIAGGLLGTWLAAPLSLAQDAPQDGAPASPTTPVASPDAPVLEGLASRPEAAGRLVRQFTFDEDQTNPGEVPIDWFRDIDSPERSLPGFPSWNRARLVYASEGGSPMRGSGAVELPVAGGSTSLVLSSGVLPVFGNADYLVSAFVRTDQLQHAKAGLIAQVLDASGSPLPGTMVASELVTTHGAWREVVAAVTVDDPRAAFIQLRLVVLQPQQISSLFPQPARASAAFAVHEADLAGTATFDDVSVLQLPRVEVSATESGGIFAFGANASAAASVRVVVRDLTGERLTVNLDAIDSSGNVVARREALNFEGQYAGEWRFALPAAGWYRVRARLTGPHGRIVGGSVADIIATPAARSQPQSDAWRMGLDLTDLQPRHRPLTPRLLSATDLSSATLPAWHASLHDEALPEHIRDLSGVLSAMILQGERITLALAPVPSQLAWDARVEMTDAWGLLQFPRHIWQGYADTLIEQLGERIEHWQVGDVGDVDAFWRSNIASEIAATSGLLNKLAPGATLHVPTNLERMWDTARIRTTDPVVLAAMVPPLQPPKGLRESLGQAFTASPGVGLRLIFDARTPSSLTAGAYQSLLAKQVVESWRLLSASPGNPAPDVSFTLAHPWRLPLAKADTKLHAVPTLGTWLTLSRMLADRRVVARLPVAVLHADGSSPIASSDVVAYVLAPDDPTSPKGGALVLWHEGLGRVQALIPAGLKALTLVDLDGNRSPLASQEGRQGDARSLRIELDDRPVFIEGVDVELLRFLAGVIVDPPSLDAAQTTQDANIRLENPWQSTITGTVTILEPGGMQSGVRDRSWRIAPRTSAFSIPPGESLALPVSVGFSSNEEAGPKRFVLGINLEADENYGIVQVERTVPLGLKDMAMDLSQVAASPGLVAIEALVTNTSTRTLSLELTALAPGTPRAKATIVNLPPGKQASRRFSFKAASVATPQVLVSVVDKAGDTRLNKSVKLEGLDVAIKAQSQADAQGQRDGAAPSP